MRRILTLFLLFFVLGINVSHAEYEPTLEEANAAFFLYQKWIIANEYIEEFNKTSNVTFMNYIWILQYFIKDFASQNFSSSWINQEMVDAIENGTKWFRLWDSITRQEVMKIVAKLSGDEISNTCSWEFSDVDKSGWGCKYIEWALGKWYITYAKTFRPEDNITKSEAMKLIFKARNIKKIYNTDNWQADYAMTAADIGLVDIYTDYNTDASRWWIFVISSKSFEQEFEDFKDEIEKWEWIYSDEWL